MDIPLKKAVFNPDDPESGLYLVSLVKDPAIGYKALIFNESKPIKLAVTNEEERIIFTPVLVPNQKIYRNIDGEEFNIVFEQDTIDALMLQFAKNHLATKTDEQHTRQLIDGVTFFESFKLSEERASQVNGFDVPMGTWFVSGKVENDEVWQKIKDGEITGVSIDGLFKTVDVQASNQLLDKIEKLIFGTFNN